MIPGFDDLKKIYESDNSIIYEAIQENDNKKVIIKVLQDEYPSPEKIVQFDNEYEFTKDINSKYVRKAFKKAKIDGHYTLFLEYVDAKTVREVFGRDNSQVAIPSLFDFLQIAVLIAEAIGVVHKHNIIHKDINGNNILINSDFTEARIIDFGISSRIDVKNWYLQSPDKLEGTLAYISPEQTGRMNRSIDYRTDLYSLGVTFYEMLTRKLPFESEDSMELVHSHIALPPHPLTEKNPNIPQTLSDIILKLLEKNAEDRYQSAFGLKSDLERLLIRDFWVSDNKTKSPKFNVKNFKPFPVAQNDFSGRLQIPEKLYGREGEIAELFVAYMDACNGESQLLMVTGYSGSGKSALVHEIYKVLKLTTSVKSYFISGKFDQFQKNVPYFALLEAFKDFVNLLLTEDVKTLERWRNKIQKAVGSNGKILTDIIPNLEFVIGKQPGVLELGAVEEQNRFVYVFRSFIEVVCSEEHPLIIFIDDLQWADLASISLLKIIMTDSNIKYLLFLGAYRNNEVSPTHPLLVTLGDIQKGKEFNTIVLNNLSIEDIENLLMDSLSSEKMYIQTLAKLIHSKTNGNAFFVNEFLKSLYTEGILQFSYPTSESKGMWVWNIGEIQKLGITDNVVELMSSKIQKLPKETQDVLKLASCIGNRFTLSNLAVIFKNSEKKTSQTLSPALKEGLVTPVGDGYKYIEVENKSIKAEYKFAHDRIQQATYNLIEETYRNQVHLEIGRLLLKNIPKENREEHIFDIVNQWNTGIDFIESESEKTELAELNIQAATKAKASAAYKPALEYFQIGVRLLPQASWGSQYNYVLSVYENTAEVAFLSGDMEYMEYIIEIVLQNTTTVLDRIGVYETKIQAHIQTDSLKAIEIGITVIKELGMNIPLKPTQVQIAFDLVKIILILFGKKIDKLIDLPQMSDKRKLAVMRILSVISAPAYLVMPDLLPIIIFKQVNLSIKYGNAPQSPFAYAGFGIVACCIIGDINRGYEFGKLAIRLLDKVSAYQIKARTMFVYNELVRHWKEHYRESLPSFLETYRLGLETGDLEYAAYSAWIYTECQSFLGEELSNLESKVALYADAINQIHQEKTLLEIKILWQYILNLLGRSENPILLIGKAFDEKALTQKLLDQKESNLLGNLYFYKMQLAYMFGDYELSIQCAKDCENYLEGQLGAPNYSLFYFYDSLCHSAVYPFVQMETNVC